MRKVTLAAVAGTVIEWFDFAMYGFMAPTLATTFFPSHDRLIGLLETFAVFAVAFALRPVGGAFFGLLGDRIGRKRILALTVLIMSASTAAVGLLPSYATAGIWAAVLLTVARCAQGFSAGGEYAGAVTYLIEHSPKERRASYGSLLPAATFGSFALAALVAYLLTAALPEATLNAWGWRVAFLVAAPMGYVAFYIRRRLDESPAFQEVVKEGGAPRTSLATTVREQWSRMLRLAGFIALTGVSFYTFSTYMTTFLREVVGLPSDSVLLSNVLALVAATVMSPLIGRVCDRVGRRMTMMAAAVLLGCLAVPAYVLAGGGGIAHALLAQILLALGAVTANVVTAVLLCEMFPTRMRYTASAVTYNIAYAIFGGTAPFVATLLIATTGSHLAPAVYIVVIAVIALIAAITIPETSRLALSRDTADQQALEADEPAALPASRAGAPHLPTVG